MAQEKPEFGKFKEQHHKFSPSVWTSTYLQLNTPNKALRNFEVKPRKGKSKGRNRSRGRWDELPDLILERVFGYLTIRERYYASLVCRHWYPAFHMPQVWSQFTLEDSTLTRARFNYYQGWQYVLDHVRTQMCLTQIGRNFRKLTFAPMLNFFNLYEFMNMISWYCEQKFFLQEAGIAQKITTLKFTFPCNMDNDEKEESLKLFGTGGRLLGAVKRLIANLPKLHRLELIDLMLDANEAQHLLDEVCDTRFLTLRTLILINTTKLHYPLLHVGVFLNLHVLVISPQNLADDVVELIAHTNLKHLHIYQNRYTPDFVTNHVSTKTWKFCKATNPKLSVHLEMECVKEKALVWPINAPVRSVIYDTSIFGVQLADVMTAVEMFRESLLVYGHRQRPRGYRARVFHERVDEALMLLCRQCTNLQTLIVSERISTQTILLIATTCKNLKQLHVRRNAVIKKFDWKYNPDWSPEYHEWLKLNSRTYANVETEISQILARPWRMLSDRNFKELYVNLYEDIK